MRAESMLATHAEIECLSRPVKLNAVAYLSCKEPGMWRKNVVE